MFSNLLSLVILIAIVAFVVLFIYAKKHGESWIEALKNLTSALHAHTNAVQTANVIAISAPPAPSALAVSSPVPAPAPAPPSAIPAALSAAAMSALATGVSTRVVPQTTEDPYANMSLRAMLVAYKADYDKLSAMAATLTQQETVRGEIDFKNGITAFTPTIEDLKSIVNDDPNHRLSSNFGADIDKLHQNMGGLMEYALRRQRMTGLAENTGPEFVTAALSGDYSKIHGV